MKRKLMLLVALVMMLSMTLAASVSAQTTNDNIVDIAAKNPNFDTLHAAIVAAGLADTLASADNTFTVFAPTDEAFAAVEAAYPGVLDMLLADPQGALTTILTYHVVPGKYMAEDVLATDSLTTVEGGDLAVSLRNGEAYVNDSRIVAVDVPAKNGVIHVIDSVLVPPAIMAALAAMPAPAATTDEAAAEPEATTEAAPAPAEEEAAPADTSDAGLKTIAEVAAEAGMFNNLLAALESTGLAETFTKPGNYTVFAPTDEAFEALGGVSLTQEQLTNILLYHVVNDRLVRDQLATDDLVPTLSGGRPLFINRTGSTINDISGAKVVVFDIPASNGIIHVIDRVMIP